MAKLYDVNVLRHARFSKLAARLAQAHEVVRIDNALAAYVIAVDALADFLHENKAKPAITLWLKGLANALADLDRGVVPPLLRPPKAGDKSLSTNEWRRFAAIAAGMTALTMCKRSRISREELSSAGMTNFGKEGPKIKRLRPITSVAVES